MIQVQKDIVFMIFVGFYLKFISVDQCVSTLRRLLDAKTTRSYTYVSSSKPFSSTQTLILDNISIPGSEKKTFSE